MLKLIRQMQITLDESLDILNNLNEFTYDDNIEISKDDGINKRALKPTKFKVGEYEYEITATMANLGDGRTVMELVFGIINTPNEPNRKNFQSDMQYQIALSRHRTSITKTGKSYSVFNRVFSLCVKYIKVYSPDIVEFDAREENRQRLYKLILTNALKYLTEYENCVRNPIDDSELTGEMFYIKKK